MLETKELYDQELAAARATFQNVKWFSATLDGTPLKCSDCKAELIEQTDPENERQDWIELHCKVCGLHPDLDVAIEQAVDDVHGMDAYRRHKEVGEDGPVYECPACKRNTLVEGENSCANCNESVDYEDECTRCGNGISLQDYIEGLDGGLCSYCNWQVDKLERND